MKDEAVIRPADVAAAHHLARLNEHVHALHVTAVPIFFKTPTRQEATNMFAQILAQEQAHAFIAWQGRKAIGYTLAFIQTRPETPFTYARRFVFLDQISVIPSLHGSGIGRQLVEAVLQVARDHGIEEVDVSTWAFNEKAQLFFTSFDFEPQLMRLSMRLTP